MKLSADAIPTKNLPTPTSPLSDRGSRQNVRNQKSLVSDLLAEHTNDLKKTKIAQEKEKHREMSTQTNPEKWVIQLNHYSFKILIIWFGF